MNLQKIQNKQQYFIDLKKKIVCQYYFSLVFSQRANSVPY